MKEQVVFSEVRICHSRCGACGKALDSWDRAFHAVFPFRLDVVRCPDCVLTPWFLTTTTS